MAENTVFKAPTQPLDLPSKGLLYPESHPLSSGKIDLYMPTAYHEDILTNKNYVQQGVVLDKFLQAIIATKVDYNDIFLGDKNSILVASRILAYGAKYSFKFTDPVSKIVEDVTIDLGDLKDKEVDWSLFKKGVNEFDYTLPLSKTTVSFKILNQKDEASIEAELKGLQKVNKNMSSDVTVRLSHSIVAVNGVRDQKTIRDFVKTIPMRDSVELKKYMASVTPDIVMKFDFTRMNGEVVEGLNIPMTVDFFWPDTGV